MRTTSIPKLPVFLAAVALLSGGAAETSRAAKGVQELSIHKIYWEYNSSANDLGVHVSLDGEDWKKLRITNPDGKMIFKVEGKGAYKELGLTELFFEGAEPSLADFPLEELLARFPEGNYEFSGKDVDNNDVTGTGVLSHAIPAGPANVVATQGPNNSLVISWDAVTAPPPGFPNEPIDIVGYQVLVGDNFQVTVPDTTTSVTISPEYAASLGSGEHPIEVLAIDVSGNQTITEASFTKP